MKLFFKGIKLLISQHLATMTHLSRNRTNQGPGVAVAMVFVLKLKAWTWIIALFRNLRYRKMVQRVERS